MLSRGGIKVKRSGIRHVTASVIGDNGDVISYLILLWPALSRVERCGYRNVRRPRRTRICAVGIKQLRLKIVRRIPRVIPDGIKPAVRRHGKSSKPMPFVCGRIVIDFYGRSKRRSVIGAAREHYICAVTGAWLANTAHHVNIVIRGSTRTVYCQEDLSYQSSGIYISAYPHPTQIDLGDLFEGWRLTANLRVTGANAPKLRAYQVLPTDEQIAVRIYISGSMNNTMGNIDRIRPAHAAVSRTAEFAG